MTPERKEEIKRSVEQVKNDKQPHMGKRYYSIALEDLEGLLATLEETEHLLTDHGPNGRNYTNEQYVTIQQQLVSQTNKLTQAEQTIARQREALVATGLPEWAVDAIGEGAKES